MSGGCDHAGVARRRVRVRGVDFHVEEEGAGPPLLLVHGGPGGDHRMFHPDLSALAPHRRLLYLDLRGHGESGWPADDAAPWGVETDADDVAALAAATAPAPVDVLGYSYGGFVALHLAARHAEAVRRLVLVSTPIGATDEAIEARIAADPRAHEMDAAETDDDRFEAYLRFYLEREPGPEKRRMTRAVDESFREERTRRLLAARAAADDRETDWPALLGACRAPALCLYGGRDPVVDGARLAAAVAGRPGFEVAAFAASRHDPFHDEPERFREVVLAFLGEEGVP